MGEWRSGCDPTDAFLLLDAYLLLMDLTPTEAQDAFQFLVRALEDVGLGWVVEQVRDKIALGKVETKRLPATEYLLEADETAFPSSGRRSTKRTARFTVSREFSVDERLDILLDGIVLAVPAIRQAAERTFDALGELKGPDAISFAPDVDGGELRTVRRGEILDRSTAAVRLEHLIAELRGASPNATSGKPAR